MKTLSVFAVALHPEGVDRNMYKFFIVRRVLSSPSTRRAWIEIIYRGKNLGTSVSPSTRRAWIEMIIG